MKKQSYIILLRGINVGGHHKVPMADLRAEMEKLGFENVVTLLNSGNVIGELLPAAEDELEERIASRLEEVFGFSIPVLVRKGAEVLQLIDSDPFKSIEVTKDTRLYVTFLKETPEAQISVPWVSEDKSYQIIDVRGRTVCSVLDVSVTKTPKGMDALEKLYGKNVTTRNWNTMVKIAEKLS